MLTERVLESVNSGRTKAFAYTKDLAYAKSFCLANFYGREEGMADMLLLTRYIKNNRGQAMVEFALALPVLMLLLIGSMEFGLVINQYLVLAEAAREGARSAALGGTNTEITAVVKTAASAIDISQLTVTISPATRIRGNGATVTVKKPVQAITPLMNPFFPAGYMIQGVATMRVE